MRSHAKASTAGSTQRQAKGLGRFFRGADAGRETSHGADGSGVPSHLRGLLLVLATAVLCTVAAPASAAESEFKFLEAFGPDGTSASGFSSSDSVAVDQSEDVVYVLDGGADALYKFDLEGNPVAFGGSSPDIEGNKLSGLSIGFGGRQVAVDSDSHTVYLTGEEEEGSPTALQAFQSNGEPALFTAGPGNGTNEIGGFQGIRGVAVDSNGSIYISGTVGSGVGSSEVSVYGATGALILPTLGGFAFVPSAGNLAVDSNGVLYAMQTGVEPTRYTPSEYPVTSSTTYTRAVPLDSYARSVAVDPVTNEVYVLDQLPVPQVAVYDEEGELLTTFAGPGEAGEVGGPDGIAVHTESGRVFVAHDPAGGPPQVEIFERERCVCPPAVEATFASEVSADSAKLGARINPNSLATTYWFEYGAAECELGGCAKVPLDGAPIAAGHKPVAVAQSVVGLAPETTYHYRVVAENALDATEGPDRTLSTQGSGLGFALGDSRVWEMVSPPNKFNGAIINAGTTAIQASAAGDKLAYASRGSIVAQPAGSRPPEPATVLAKRGTDGKWASEDLTPPHSVSAQVSSATLFKLFTPDLLRAEVEPADDTPHSPLASERTPYLWSEGSPPLFDPLVNPTNVPPGTEFGPKPGVIGSDQPVQIEGASADLAHVVIASENPLAEGAADGSIYLWSDGQLEAVSELPQSEGGAVVLGMLGSGRGSVRHAVSEDGSRVFWTPGGGYAASGIDLQALYLRDTLAGESVRLDVVQPGGGGAGANRPAFNVASADGSVVFFTDSQQLTAGASPSGRDLYRCEIGPVEGSLGCASLTDISVAVQAGESAEVLDQVSGASEDGTRLYFVARGVLDETANEQGETASAGEPNLYLWQEGQGARFIATLSKEDAPVWGISGIVSGFALDISAAASPSGRFFAFTSQRSLTGDENLNGAGEPTTEVFLYDAEADAAPLTCVSCNPSGAAPVGEQVPSKVNFPPDPGGLWGDRWAAATLPEATQSRSEGRSLYRPRAVLDSGRVFFNSVDPLVPADSNGNWDVYQHEPLGVGSCTAQTGGAAASRSGGGCVGLISSGTSEGDAGFLDASTSGGDVFFLARGRLSALDTDEEIDVYDARVNGITAQLPSRAECLGEACQPPATPPNDPTPASTSFKGAGNAKPNARKRCARGKRQIRRGGKARCVARKGKQRQKRAGQSGRASR